MYTRNMLLSGEQPVVYADTIINGVFSMFYDQRRRGKAYGSVTASTPGDTNYLIDFFRSMGFTVENIWSDQTNNHFTVSW